MDDHVASLFARMRLGTRLISLDLLPLGGPSRKTANSKRELLNLAPNDDASFFEHEVVDSKEVYHDTVSWASKKMNDENRLRYYCYTRVGSTDIAKFVCSNPGCQSDLVDDPATAVIDDQQSCCLIGACVYCGLTRAMTTRASSGMTKP